MTSLAYWISTAPSWISWLQPWARIERRAAHRHHVAAEFGRVARGDQRPGLRRRLDHDRSERQASDHPTAVREVARVGFDPRGLFGDQQAALADRRLPRFVFGRIADVDTPGDDGDGAAFHRAVMGSGIDSARETRHHCHPLAAEIVRKDAREAARRGRRIARPNHGDRRLFEQREVALDDQRGRRGSSSASSGG